MELIYSMRRKPLKCEPPHFDNATDTDTVRPICTISTANIIAYSSPTELTDVEGDTWGGHVYVCDLDTPWNSYKVASTSHPVSALEWHIEGKQLLIATTVGDVSVYGQKDYLLNDWQCLFTASFPGEHIIKAAFFHNGRRLVIVDKKPEAPITDRIQLLRPTPTLKGFGGVGSVGALVITSTGLAGAVWRGAGGGPVQTATEGLRPSLCTITAAAIGHKNGNLLVAATCAGEAGGGGGCVRCFLVGAPRTPPPALRPQPLPALSLPGGAPPVSVTWSLREDSDSLLVAGSTLSLWKCTERAHPVHKLLSKGPLQGSTTPGGGQKPASDSFNTVVWQKTAVWPIEGESAICIASTKLPLGAPHAVLATPRALHLLARDTHHVLCSRQVVTNGTPGLAPEAPAAAASPPKKPKYGPGVLPPAPGRGLVSHVELSYLGGVAVCVDTHAQLHVYKLPQPGPDIPTPASVQQASSLLEYSLVSGYDCLDTLLTLKHNMIELLYDRLSETFQRQPPAFQQYYYQTCLKLKIALCRLSPSLQTLASSLTSVQMLHAILAACAPAPPAPPAPPPAPAPPAAPRDERTDAPPTEDDDEKTLAALEAKPELITDTTTLQALRLGLQRALDIGMTAIAQHAQPQHHQHGHDVWSEPASLAVLRKCIVAWRACGRGGGGEALSRVLARLHQHAPRHDLYEECSALAAQSSSPRVWESLPRCNVSAPHGKPWPLYLEYGVEPESLRYAPEAPAYAQCESVPPVAMDSIRYMYLGGGWRPGAWRACARCGARALPAAHTQRHPLQRAYDARFLDHCRCGGKWSLCKNI